VIWYKFKDVVEERQYLHHITHSFQLN
jgi:hypothetical protein